MYDYNKIPALVMKVGVRNALINGKKCAIEAAPIKCDGGIYIPYSTLSAISNTEAKTKINGADYVKIEDIEDVYVNYDEMGIIIIDGCKCVLGINRSEDMNFLLSLTNRFIFDIDPVKMNIKEYAPATEEERAGFRALGEQVVDIFKKRSGKHPCLLADESVFAKLKAAYEGDDSDLKSQIAKLIENTEKTFKKPMYSMADGDTRLVEPLVNKNGGDGYDVGGRLYGQENHTYAMMDMAFAYRITGDVRYAKCAYYIGESVGSWTHWGPGHFLNTSGATLTMAIAYDWLYNAWRELGLDSGVIASAIYRNGVYHGYNSFINDNCDYPSKKQGTGWRFKNKPDNWNVVCNAGMIAGSLALIADGETDVINTEMTSKMTELIGACLSSVMQNGLVLKQYAPDGSYVESNSYWSYGTGNLFRVMALLYSALGSDLGIHNAPGLDRTCYYAINTESADYVGWNYHDGSLSGQDTQYFNLFATVSGDEMLYAIRRSQIKRGKAVTIFDALYHPDVNGKSIPELSGIPLDHYMEGIDGFTVRNGWESGSLFAGIMGGYNPKGGSHNQLDSGSFVYHNGGRMWITDMGPDYYNTYRYFENYALYRRNGEGNNNLVLKSLPYGQAMNVTSKIIEHSSKDTSAYAIIDNAPAYDGRTEYAKRGMLLTNDRKTTVIQDEVKFNAPETAYWIAHYESDKITAEISKDGKLCTMTHKDGGELTLTLLSQNVKFEIMNCYDFLLDGTDNFEGEYSRENHRRIVIRFENVTEINCAVVLEMKGEHGYTEIIPMSEWKNA